MTATVDWARRTLRPITGDDLSVLDDMLEGVSVVAFGEALHMAAQPLEWRNRLFQYLVERHGFTAIAIESGGVEGQIVHDYVRGGDADLDAVVAQGFGWTFDCLPQNRDLVRWMRTRNQNQPDARPLNFYGFDVAGSIGNTAARHGPDIALTAALDYLQRVDPDAATAFRARVAAFMPHLRFNAARGPDDPGYDRLDAAQRDTLTATIADLITLLERKEHGCAADAWGHFAALSARQADAYLRHIPLDWTPAPDPRVFPNPAMKHVFTAEETRDRAQADNIDWVLRQEGEGAKILVFAHRCHVSTAPVTRTIAWPGAPEHRRHPMMGCYLRPRLGLKLLTIGNVVGAADTDAAPETLDGMCRAVGVPQYILDLRAAPPSLRQEHVLAHNRQMFRLAPAQAFDLLLYMDRVTKAVP